MRRSTFLLFGVALLFSAVRLEAGTYPDRRILLPYQTVATAGDLWALRYNPAALAVDDDLQMILAHTYNDSDLAGNDLIYLSKHGLAVGIEWLGSGGEPKARHQTVGWGGEVRKRIFFGTSYRWVVSDNPAENKAHFWTTALMVRPGKRVSFGVRVDNLNHMPYLGERMATLYTYSAGLNLARGRIVLGVDYTQATGQRLPDGTTQLSAAVEPVNGLVLYGDYGDKGQPLYDLSGSTEKFGLGVRLNLTQFMVSSYNAFNEHGKFFRGNFAAGSFEHRRRTAVPGRREVADIHLSGRLPEREPPRFFFLPAQPHTMKSSPLWIE